MNIVLTSGMAWMIAPSQWTLSQYSADAGETRLKCKRFQLNFQWFEQTALILNHLKPLLCYVMLCALQSTSSSYILTFGMKYIVILVWPPKELRNRLVARGRKRLCTTVLGRCLMYPVLISKAFL